VQVCMIGSWADRKGAIKGVKVRFYIDPESGEPHVEIHGVSEQEVRTVLTRPLGDRPRRGGLGWHWARRPQGGIFESST